MPLDMVKIEFFIPLLEYPVKIICIRSSDVPQTTKSNYESIHTETVFWYKILHIRKHIYTYTYTQYSPNRGENWKFHIYYIKRHSFVFLAKDREFPKDIFQILLIMNHG